MVYIDPNDTYNRKGSKHNIDRNTYLSDAMRFAKRGNALPHAKVNPEIVRKIRIEADNGITAKYQSSEHGLHIRTIEAIRSYKTWRQV